MFLFNKYRYELCTCVNKEIYVVYVKHASACSANLVVGTSTPGSERYAFYTPPLRHGEGRVID